MIYVTADLHGYPLEKFQQLLKKADFSEEDFLFIIGDVVDRGFDGVEILKWLMEQPNVELIMGNHEAMMLACAFLFVEVTPRNIDALTMDRLGAVNLWRSNGGDSTIDALVKTKPSTRAEIFEFLRECPLYDTVAIGDKNYLLVHGGLGNYKEGKKLSEYAAADLLWSRTYPSIKYSEQFTTIVGHTPTAMYGGEYLGKIYKSDTWINVDVGAARGVAPALLRLDDMKEFYLE
ncbi:MAG: fructose-bisphosphatase class III [Clostridia bacterium]|nr:fructose-bisphosphatase class III [Clostridia bacterium]